MRILHVSDRLTDRGGAYRHLLGILDEQAREHALCLAVGCEHRGIVAPCPTCKVPGLEARVRTPVDLLPVLRAFQPDVVHVHTVMNPEALEQVGALAGFQKVLTVQDHRSFCPGKGKWTESGELCREPMNETLCWSCFSDDGYFREILSLTRERRDALLAFRVVVLSHYMKRELEAVGVEDAAVIPPFVHGLDRDAAPNGPPCVLFVGRLVEAKGVREAVEAWRRSGVSLPLVFAGTGPLRAELGKREVLGWVPHERMASTYRRAKALLMPSRWQEPFGLAGLEAVTLGVPVVAWDSGGIPEWHSGEGLVPWGDVDGLASELAAAAGRRAEPPRGFEPEPLMARLFSVYTGGGDRSSRRRPAAR